MNESCPWCQAPRGSGPDCQRCGANYAKAEAIKTQGRAGAAAPAPAAPVEEFAAVVVTPEGAMFAEREGVEDPGLELKFCAAAIPIMLCIALAFHAGGIGQFLQRTFLTMPVHELGHAVTAWLCGYTAIPTLWRTLVPEARGFVAPVLLAGGMGYMMFRAWRAEKHLLLVLGGVVLALQGAGTFAIREKTANMLITFGGDALGMVLATLLMASFFFGKQTQLYKGSLRWGFVAIGAAAFVDMFAVWWAARRDFGRIPFGEMEGTGLSDATKLVDDFGWSADQLIRRHIVVGVCCLVALLAIYGWGVWRAWQEAEAAKRRVSSA